MEQGSTTLEAATLFAGEAWFDPIEGGIRERVHGFIKELVEQEPAAALVAVLMGRIERDNDRKAFEGWEAPGAAISPSPSPAPVADGQARG